MIEAQAKGPLSEEAYLEALAASKRIARNGVDNALLVFQLAYRSLALNSATPA